MEAWDFTLGNGQSVRVVYTPKWASSDRAMLSYRYDHFAFHGSAISETGYLSVFVSVSAEISIEDAQAYAKQKITELSGIGFEEWEGQLSLF